MIADPPGFTPEQVLAYQPNKWMLLDGSLISFDGA
jgi:hypothetical protein